MVSPVFGGTPPTLSVPQKTIDLGAVLRGRNVPLEFELTNRGEAPLRILSARPSCRCTVASFPETIAPGATEKLTAHLETTELWGDVTRVIDLETNDPSRRDFQLTIIARVIGSVDFLPPMNLTLSSRRPEFTETAVLLRKTADEAGDFVVGSVRASVPWLAVEVVRLTEKRPAAGGLPTGRPGDWLLTARLQGQVPHGRSEPEITITTGLELEPEIVIPIKVDYQPAMRLSRPSVVLQGTSASSGTSVMVTLREGVEAKQVTLTSEPADLAVDVKDWGSGRLELTLRWLGESAGNGAVTLNVGTEEFHLPVRRL